MIRAAGLVSILLIGLLAILALVGIADTREQVPASRPTPTSTAPAVEA